MAGSRVVLVGTPEYAHAELTDIPQVRANLADLARVLAAPRLGGLPAAHVVVAPEQAGVPEIGGLLGRAAAAAEDLLLFYFAGHGLLDRRRRAATWACTLHPGRPRLQRAALRDRPRHLPRTAGPPTAWSSSTAATAAGRSAPCPATRLQAALDQLRIGGTFILAAAPANRLALVRDGEPHTAFTGRLLRPAEHGADYGRRAADPRRDLPRLHARLRADGLPLPQKRDTATADLFGLVRNRWQGAAQASSTAAAPSAPRPPTTTVLGAWTRSTINEAERAVHAVTNDTMRAEVLAGLARTVATIDPQRAVTLALQVPVRTANRLLHRPPAWWIVAEAAQALALAEPDQAEAFVAPYPDLRQRGLLFATVGAALAPTDPECADRLIARAELPDIPEQTFDRPMHLAVVAEIVAKRDPGRAEQVAARIPDPGWRTMALGMIALQIAGRDPDRAQRLGETSDDASWSARVLAEVGRAVATTDADRAVRLITQAERLAHSLAKASDRGLVLAGAARALAAVGSDRAVVLADQAYRLIDTSLDVPAGDAVAATRILAAVHPDAAYLLAGTVTHKPSKARILAEVLRAYAASDPQRAVALAPEVSFAVGAAADDLEVCLDIARTLVAATRSPGPADLAAWERITAEFGTYFRVQLLARLSLAQAAAEPETAERLARQAQSRAESIKDKVWAARALTRVAQIWLGLDEAD